MPFWWLVYVIKLAPKNRKKLKLVIVRDQMSVGLEVGNRLTLLIPIYVPMTGENLYISWKFIALSYIETPSSKSDDIFLILEMGKVQSVGFR